MSIDTIFQQLGIIPAALITRSLDKSRKEDIITKIPWSIVYLTDKDNGDFSSYFKTIKCEPINKRILTSADSAKDIVPSKSKLPIVLLAEIESESEKQLPPHILKSYIKSTFESTLEKILATSGVIFLNDIPEDYYEYINDVVVKYPRRNSIYIFENKDNQYISYWKSSGYAIVEKESFAESCATSLYEDIESENDDGKTYEHFFVNEEFCKIEAESLFKISHFGQLLTQERVGDIPILSAGDIPTFFKFFLERSVGGFPDWYCYDESIGFHLTRSIEDKIYKDINKALISADTRDRTASPVLLRGQAFSGKTNILCSVAYKIYNAKKYPVIYLPNTGFPLELKDFSEGLNYLIENIENLSQRRVPTLIVWDSACKQANDLCFALKLLKKLRSEGRQVQLLCSSYTYESDDSKPYLKEFSDIKIPEKLDDKEKDDLFVILKNKGGFADSEVSYYMEKSSANPDFIASLYQFPRIRKQLQLHITEESDSINDDLNNIFNKIIENEFEKNIENSWSIMFEDQFAKLNFNESSDNVAENPQRKKDFLADLHHVIACIALCTYYKLQIPIELVLRLLKTHDFTSPDYQIYNVFINNCMLREFYGNTITLEIRSALEANILLNEDQEKGLSKFQLLLDIVDAINFNNEGEVELLRKLIQSTGPNSKLLGRKSEYSLWDSNFNDFPLLWDKLKIHREKTVAANRMLPQELSLIREWYKNKPSDSQKIEALEDAKKNAEDALYKLKEKGTSWEANLLVEYCNISIEILTAKGQINKESYRSLYNSVCPTLLSLIHSSDNSYTRVTLLKLGILYFRTLAEESERCELLNQLSHFCDLFESEESDNELDRHIAEVNALIDDFNISDSLFNKSISENKPYGIYIKVKNGLRQVPLGYKKDQAADLLERYLEKKDYWNIVSKDYGCMFLFIELKWLVLTNHDILPKKERNRVALSKEDWELIYCLCKTYFDCKDSFGSPAIQYLYALCSVNLPMYAKQYVRILQELRDALIYFDRKSWYLICDQSGNPVVCSGEIKQFDEKKYHGRLKINKIGNGDVPLFDDIYFRPQDVRLLSSQCVRGQTTKDFWLALSFSGLQAVMLEE